DAVPVVTSFLERPDGRILLLRRSEKVRTFRGRWAAVSGYMEASPPETQARQEIREEVGFADAEVERVATAPPVYARDGPRMFVVHPFRFRVRRSDVRLDWEHTESEWVEPGEILRRPTVPKLDRVWAAVAPPASEEKRV
ncbi:MAG TPA: NUDIX domain-containing protein, partial [Thermoplasmata archaeon]|nr:NUDIX domain-containing protein [Thermoplasmata archaeon]